MRTKNNSAASLVTCLRQAGGRYGPGHYYGRPVVKLSLGDEWQEQIAAYYSALRETLVGLGPR